MSEAYPDCPNCQSSSTSYTEGRVKTCSECAHQWNVDTGKTVS